MTGKRGAFILADAPADGRADRQGLRSPNDPIS